MRHLTDIQFSALVDDALPAGERATCEAHMADCEPCRARLAEYAALQQSLGSSLAHDPGEEYFARFAARVQARIAAGPEARKAPKSRRSPTAWLMTPRGLSFAGGMAALVLTAGLAWMRFARHDDVAGTLRAGRETPLGEDVREPAIAQDTPATDVLPGSGEGLSSKVLRDDPDARRERDQTMARAPRPAQERAAAPARGLSAEGVSPASPQVEPRATAAGDPERPVATARAPEQAVPRSAPVASAQPVSPPAEAMQESPAAPAATRSLFRSDAPAKRAPSPAALTPPSAGGSAMARDESQPSDARANSLGAATTLTRCGAVRDGAGRAVAGALVTVVGRRMSSVRTNADGSFCLVGSSPGDTLSVLRVGYAPQRLVLTPNSTLAVTLEPAGTLGQSPVLALGGERSRKPGAPLTLGRSELAPASDVFASESATVRASVVKARVAAALARRDRSAAGHDRAAEIWQAITAGLSGAGGWEAGFQAIASLREAQLLEPTTSRSARLRATMAAFVAAVPRSLPERATVLRWQAELTSP